LSRLLAGAFRTSRDNFSVTQTRVRMFTTHNQVRFFYLPLRPPPPPLLLLSSVALPLLPRPSSAYHPWSRRHPHRTTTPPPLSLDLLYLQRQSPPPPPARRTAPTPNSATDVTRHCPLLPPCSATTAATLVSAAPIPHESDSPTRKIQRGGGRVSGREF
jgi:hypothetical protein